MNGTRYTADTHCVAIERGSEQEQRDDDAWAAGHMATMCVCGGITNAIRGGSKECRLADAAAAKQMPKHANVYLEKSAKSKAGWGQRRRRGMRGEQRRRRTRKRWAQWRRASACPLPTVHTMKKRKRRMGRRRRPERRQGGGGAVACEKASWHTRRGLRL